MSPACCTERLRAGDRLVVLHAGAEATAGAAAWPDWESGCPAAASPRAAAPSTAPSTAPSAAPAAAPAAPWSDWAHWSSWAAARELDVVGLDVTLCDGDAVAALTHLLWWDPSVRGVLVAEEATDAGTDVDAVRQAMALTGSTATLLVDTGGSRVWSR